MIKRFIPVVLCLLLLIDLFPTAASAASYKGASSWAVPELDKAAGYGLITDRIRDNVSANITREEFAEITVRLYEKCTGKKASPGTASFNDTSNPEILKAANMGMVNGVGGGKFAPRQLVTREQMGAILLRTLKVISAGADFSTTGAAKFADDRSISSWAKDGVYYCAKNGIIKGVGGNKFNPQGNSTREAAIIVCTRSYGLYAPAGGGNSQSDTVVTSNEILLINDFQFMKGEYAVHEIGNETFIFVPRDKFKFAFKQPYSGDYIYPDVIEQDGLITMTWRNMEGEIYLEINLAVDSTEAIVNGQSLDIIAGPYYEGDMVYIPVNLFVEIFEMRAEDFQGMACLQGKEDFPLDVLSGSWNYSQMSVFTGYKDLLTGAVSLPSFDFSYIFNTDGTYRLGMVSGGGYEDTLILQKGKYKVIGNTVILYDIYETLYKGNPFVLKYENQHADRFEYTFIDNYNASENKIELQGNWYHRP